MSAFIHSPAHIIAIVASAARLNLGTVRHRRTVYDLANLADCEMLMAALYRANVRSVNHRYTERSRVANPALTASAFIVAVGTPLGAAALCKAIDSLEYQSDQRPDWDKSTACAILTQLRERAERVAIDRASIANARAAQGAAANLEAYKLANVWAIN